MFRRRHVILASGVVVVMAQQNKVVIITSKPTACATAGCRLRQADPAGAWLRRIRGPLEAQHPRADGGRLPGVQHDVMSRDLDCCSMMLARKLG